MYDRQTESWWQQFGGDAIVGVMSGKRLRLVPSRLESFGRFRQRLPNGQVLIPNNPAARDYGTNPYVRYDASGQRPFLYDGPLPDGIDPMERVIAVEARPGYHEAWSLPLLRERGAIESGDIILKWQAGQTSALDKKTIAGGRDIGKWLCSGGKADNCPIFPTTSRLRLHSTLSGRRALFTRQRRPVRRIEANLATVRYG
jgi:hypothetical protein